MCHSGVALVSVLATAALVAPSMAMATQPAWQQVGDPVAQSGRVLGGFDLKRIGGVPYVAWSEESTETYSKYIDVIKVARFDADSDAWVQVGPVVNHALKYDPPRDATHPSLAAGPGDVPWIAWQEVDEHGIDQIRAAHLSADGESWVEPDGRDYAINNVPSARDWAEYGPSVYASHAPDLVFIGERPYIVSRGANPTEEELELVRLAASGDSWEMVGWPPVEIPKSAPIASVSGGLLHVGGNSFDSGQIIRLDQDGQWQWLSGLRQCASSIEKIEGMTSLDGTLYALWEADEDEHCDPASVAYVSRFVNGSWQVVGGGPLGPGSYGVDLRVAGGRLYAAWFSGYGADRTLHVSRLAGDGESWIGQPDVVLPAGFGDAALSAIGGVPYVAASYGLAYGPNGYTYGSTLVVDKLDGAEDPVGPDDGEGSGPGTDPDVTVRPSYHPRFVDCGWLREGTSESDHLYAGEGDIRGYAGDDEIFASGGDDCIRGGGGDDTVYASAGDDLLKGGPGNDRMYGEEGGDALYGERGDDLLKGGIGNDLLVGGLGKDTFYGRPGSDTIHAADGVAEEVYCGAGDDTAVADRSDRLHSCELVAFR
jgi:hypothetical protein